ncbi:DUF3955 domain-containing protein [Enterococcus faecalis]|nr:DUF3955 domain-containing protein [Enterococcus faecalis]EGO8969212.1 DUF3955 domain-containing protein [Enterococcus faecalis]EGO9196621.1 DUF3955 domain-containing protein [Enterococcus faecalis]
MPKKKLTFLIYLSDSSLKEELKLKKYRISLFLGLISLLLFMISILVGSTLSSDVLLKEPAFFCTPLGYFFLFIALLSVITITCKEHMNQKGKTKQP